VFYVATYATINSSRPHTSSLTQALDAVTAQYGDCCRENPAAEVVIMGDSAGGWLATSLLLRATSTSPPKGSRPPCGALLLSPWLDLTLTSNLDSTTSNRTSDFMVDTFIDVFTYSLTLTSTVTSFPNLLRAVHARKVSGRLPPIQIICGGGEIMADESRALFEVAGGGHGGGASLYVGRKAPHIFVMSPLFTPEGLDGWDEAWKVITAKLAAFFSGDDTGCHLDTFYEDERFSESAAEFVGRAIEPIREGNIRTYSF